jgi:uncharacterized protein (DUF736 family)
VTYEPKDMSFSLFPNKDKKTDKHPNLTGTAIINGTAYFIDGWTNVDRNGNKYINGKLKPKGAQREAPAHHPDVDRRSGIGLPDEDEIPF